MKIHLLVSVVLCFFSYIQCYPEGAPKDACNELCPNHQDADPKSGTAPYSVTISKSQISAGDNVTVTIKGLDSKKFKGFILVARKPKTRKNIGIFKPKSSNAKALECTEGVKNAATHSSNDEKSKVDVEWTAPSDFKGKVEFRATIVKEFDEFYKNVKSNQVTVK